jgi:hypothetical protein
MSEKYAIVITTINHPTKAVREIARSAPQLRAEFIAIGDHKSPPDFHQPGCTYLNLDAQVKTGLRYAAQAPTRHYARKNVGYLLSIKHGATVIIETDDDNIPYEHFWMPRNADVTARVVENHDWVNVYSYFSDDRIWPRGFPLDEVSRTPRLSREIDRQSIRCPIQQGLADGDPDVDAIYRLILPLPMYFRNDEPIALRNAWCPFNSQNTTWFSEVFPLLYLPYYCSFRMTDIWRSFVAQRIAHLNGWGILFHAPNVYQERNEHNLMRDFADEIPGYLNNARIRAALGELKLPSGQLEIPDAMRECYRQLVGLGFIGSAELPLLTAWLEDVASLTATST